MSVRALIPRLERGTAEIDAIDEELEGFGVELDAALARFAGGRPTERAFFQSLGCDPEAGSIEVEKLDAVAALVGEDEKSVAGGGGLELVRGQAMEAVERLAHVAGIEREEDLERGAGEV